MTVKSRQSNPIALSDLTYENRIRALRDGRLNFHHLAAEWASAPMAARRIFGNSLNNFLETHRQFMPAPPTALDFMLRLVRPPCPPPAAPAATRLEQRVRGEVSCADLLSEWRRAPAGARQIFGGDLIQFLRLHGVFAGPPP